MAANDSGTTEEKRHTRSGGVESAATGSTRGATIAGAAECRAIGSRRQVGARAPTLRWVVAGMEYHQQRRRRRRSPSGMGTAIWGFMARSPAGPPWHPVDGAGQQPAAGNVLARTNPGAVFSGGDGSAAESAGTAEALELVAEMEERERQQPEACDVQPGMPPQELNTPPHTPPWSSQGQHIEPGWPQLVHASQSESSDLEELELPTHDEGECEAAAVQSQEGWGASSTEPVLPMETPSGDSYYRGHYGRRLLDIDALPEQQESDRWERRGAPPGPPQLQ